MIDTKGSWPDKLTAANARAVLSRRASLLSIIRRYFKQQNVLEVETPCLSRFAVSDPQLDSLQLQTSSLDASSPQTPPLQYLHTSPELAMKQLLSLGSGSIYQIAKVFRDDPPGKLHQKEFTMLEWYRLDYDMLQLIDDVSALLSLFFPARSAHTLSYREAFVRYLGIDPHTASLSELKSLARKNIDVAMDDDDRDMWLDLLLSHCIQPKLGKGELTYLYDYPASQAALSKVLVDESGTPVAKRFELFIQGVEIANGYQELVDASEHRRRFEADNQKRRSLGKAVGPIDADFLRAVDNGIPTCSGVALGIDRLLLFADLREVQP